MGGAAKRGGAFGFPDANVLFRIREIFNGPLKGGFGSSSTTAQNGLQVISGRLQPAWPAGAVASPTPIGWLSGQLLYAGQGAAGVQGAGSIVYFIDANGCTSIKFSEPNNGQGVFRAPTNAANAPVSLPLYQRLNIAGVPIMRPFYRYRLRCPVINPVPTGTNQFEFGAVSCAGAAAPTGLRSGTTKIGVTFCSDAALYGGNWHILQRNVSGGPLVVGGDLGVTATAWHVLELLYREGQVGQLELRIDDVTVAVIPDSQLPTAGGDPAASFVPSQSCFNATAALNAQQPRVGETEYTIFEGSA